MSKYVRARREKGRDAAGAVHAAFASVGPALVVTTLIIAAGFLVLSLSSFDLNASMGRLTAITVGLALFADFFFLPPLLLILGERKQAAEDLNKQTMTGDTDEHALLPA